MKTIYIIIVLIICFSVLKKINRAEPNQLYSKYEAELIFSQMNNWKIDK